MERGLSTQAGKQASSLQVSLSDSRASHTGHWARVHRMTGSLLLAEWNTSCVGRLGAPEGGVW